MPQTQTQMNPETKSADALAREAMLVINSGYCDSVKPIRPARRIIPALENDDDQKNNQELEQALAALDGGACLI
jgi:hypothetical protein